MPDRKMTNDQWDAYVARRGSMDGAQLSLFDRVSDDEHVIEIVEHDTAERWHCKTCGRWFSTYRAASTHSNPPLRSSGWADDDPTGVVPPTDITAPKPWGMCVLCDEPIGHYDPWVQLNPVQLSHHECSLRSVLGGIGHQLGHAYWCQQMHDTDAGLTYRQSAQMVKALVEVLGIDEVAGRATTT